MIATIEGKVIKVSVNKDNRYCLRIEVDKNGIEKNTDKYYKLLPVEEDDKGEVILAYAQPVAKDEKENYYYVEIYVSSKSCKLIDPVSIPLVIGKKMKIKFEYISRLINETILDATQGQKTAQGQQIEIVECELYE